MFLKVYSPTALRRYCRRLAMLLPAAMLSLAGAHWLSLAACEVYIGRLSPSGKRLITYAWDTRELLPVAAHVRDTQTGRVLHELSDFGASRGEYIHWMDDSTVILLTRDAKDRYHSVVVDLDPNPRILQKDAVAGKQVDVVCSIGEGRWISAVHSDEGTSPQHLGLVENNSQWLARVEYGSDEYVSVSAAEDAPVIGVWIRPSSSAGAKGDFLATDGKSRVLVQFDAMTGKKLRLVPGNFYTIFGSSRYGWVPKPNSLEVVTLDNLSTPVARFSVSKVGRIPILVDDKRVAAVPHGGGNVTVQNMRTDETKEFFIEPCHHFHPSGDGNLLYVDTIGHLKKMDLETGAVTDLVNTRPGFKIARAVSLAGLPVFFLTGIGVIAWSKSQSPFLDMGLLFGLVAIVLAVWTAFASSHEAGILLALVQVFLGGTLAVLFVWLASSRSLWGVGIPVVAAAIAGMLVIYGLARTNLVPSPHAGTWLEILAGGSLIVGFLSLGNVCFRHLFGRIERTGEEAEGQKGFSLRQVMIVIAAIGLVFASLRFLKSQAGEVGPSASAWTAGVWIVCFAALYAACVFLALAAAFKVRNLFLSALMTSAFSTIAVVMFASLSQVAGLAVLAQDAELIYAQPVLVCLLAWLATRVGQRSGYQLRRTSVRASNPG